MTDSKEQFSDSVSDLAVQLEALSKTASALAADAGSAFAQNSASHAEPFLVTGLTVFVLACIVGYHVVWRVTPALHSPLMGITNAISSVIIVGALLAAGPAVAGISKTFGFLAVVLASVNIFGGFIITRRMLHMFKKKG